MKFFFNILLTLTFFQLSISGFSTGHIAMSDQGFYEGIVRVKSAENSYFSVLATDLNAKLTCKIFGFSGFNGYEKYPFLIKGVASRNSHTVTSSYIYVPTNSNKYNELYNSGKASHVAETMSLLGPQKFYTLTQKDRGIKTGNLIGNLQCR